MTDNFSNKIMSWTIKDSALTGIATSYLISNPLGFYNKIQIIHNISTFAFGNGLRISFRSMLIP